MDTRLHWKNFYYTPRMVLRKNVFWYFLKRITNWMIYFTLLSSIMYKPFVLAMKMSFQFISLRMSFLWSLFNEHSCHLYFWVLCMNFLEWVEVCTLHELKFECGMKWMILIARWNKWTWAFLRNCCISVEYVRTAAMSKTICCELSGQSKCILLVMQCVCVCVCV